MLAVALKHLQFTPIHYQQGNYRDMLGFVEFIDKQTHGCAVAAVICTFPVTITACFPTILFSKTKTDSLRSCYVFATLKTSK